MFSGLILLFDPRREHSFVPIGSSIAAGAQGLSRLAASLRPPAGPGVDWPEHGGMLGWRWTERLTQQAISIRCFSIISTPLLTNRGSARPRAGPSVGADGSDPAPPSDVILSPGKTPRSAPSTAGNTSPATLT